MADDSEDDALSVNTSVSGRGSKMDLRQATSRIKTEALRSMRTTDKGENDDNRTPDSEGGDREAVDPAGSNDIPPVDIAKEGETETAVTHDDVEPQQQAVGEETIGLDLFVCLYLSVRFLFRFLLSDEPVSFPVKSAYDGHTSEASTKVDYTIGGYASAEADEEDSDLDYYGEGSDSSARYSLSVCPSVCLSVCLSV